MPKLPNSYCLKINGVPYDSKPAMYISVGKKVLKSLQGVAARR